LTRPTMWNEIDLTDFSQPRCTFPVHELIRSLSTLSQIPIFSEDFANLLEDYASQELLKSLKEETKNTDQNQGQKNVRTILEEFPNGWRSVREQFYLPKPPPPNSEKCRELPIYFVGNSLGLQHKGVERTIQSYLQRWKEMAVAGHFYEDGQTIPFSRCSDRISPLLCEVVGARFESEVCLMNTLSVNLHLLLAAFYRPDERRNKILIEKGAFPSDIHVVISHIKHHGLDPSEYILELQPRGDQLFYWEDIEHLFHCDGHRIATVLLSGVQYYTGQLFPMEKITKLAHSKGCLVGFDLAHAVGNVPLQLHDWDVDFAAWCSYKYLNGGPGATSAIFLHHRHSDMGNQLPRLTGWFGIPHELRFGFKQNNHELVPDVGARGFRISTDNVFGTIPLIPSLELMNKLKMKNIRNKSELLTAYLELLLFEHLQQDTKLVILTPADPKSRGSQLSVTFPGIEGLNEKLRVSGIYLDFRPPSSHRITPIPMYNSFADVFNFVKRVNQILEQQQQQQKKQEN